MLFSMIIVFGSINIDMVMPVDRFPAPGETVLCSADYLSRPGGKGANQAMAAARAGAKVAIVGKIGDDSFGRRSVNNLKSQSIWTSGIAISDDRPTGCATIAVDRSGANIVMVAPGANLEAMADQVPDEIMTPKNIILAQMEVTPEETFSVLERAHRLGATTILNAAPAGSAPIPKNILDSVDYLMLNEIEAQQFAQNLGMEEPDSIALAQKIAKLAESLTCIITMEDKGAVAATGTETWRIKALPVEVVDTTGAGDAFCGIFAAALQTGLSMTDALHRASVGASLSCLGLGAQSGMPFSEDIEEKLQSLPYPEKL